MKRFLLVASILLMLGTCEATNIADIRSKTHHIQQSAIFGSASCSATAIGPHALLTASHCEVATDDIDVDEQSAQIVRTVRDGHDHSILYLKGVEFKEWSGMSDAHIQVGDDVFMFGNPGEMADIFRKGYLSRERVKTKLTGESLVIWYFDINIFYGDSGSGIFDKHGKLVTVLSFMTTQTNEEHHFSMTGAFQMVFTKEQLEEARKY